jgi:hypothetical protein
MRDQTRYGLAGLLIGLTLAAQPTIGQLANNVAPTPAITDNSDAIATTAWVKSVIPPGAMLPGAQASPSSAIATAGGLNAICQGAPMGAHTIVQRWFTFQDQFGNSFYVPAC